MAKKKRYKVNKEFQSREAIKRLSPRSNCQNVTALTTLERLEFQKIFFGSVNNDGGRQVLSSVPWPHHFEIHFTGPGRV